MGYMTTNWYLSVSIALLLLLQRLVFIIKYVDKQYTQNCN